MYDLVAPGDSLKLCAKRKRQREQLVRSRSSGWPPEAEEKAQREWFGYVSS